jgi:hypothetical protein
MSKCKNCNCICHCSLKEHSDMYGVCSCTACSCGGDTIHELAKANPDKAYKELEKERAEQATYEHSGNVSIVKEKVFGGVTVVDSTDDCESCQ